MTSSVYVTNTGNKHEKARILKEVYLLLLTSDGVLCS